MIESIAEFLPSQVKHTEPEGGMFLWITLPEGMSSLELAEYAMDEKVVLFLVMLFTLKNLK